MRKLILLGALCFVLSSMLMPNYAASAKTSLITKKKIILQGSRTHPMYGWEFLISFRTGTNTVIGVDSPDVHVTGFTYSSASATASTITVNDFQISLLETTGPIDASGNYTVF